MRAGAEEEPLANEGRMGIDAAFVGDDGEAAPELEVIGLGVNEQELSVLRGDKQLVLGGDDGGIFGEGFVLGSPERLQIVRHVQAVELVVNAEQPVADDDWRVHVRRERLINGQWLGDDAAGVKSKEPSAVVLGAEEQLVLPNQRGRHIEVVFVLRRERPQPLAACRVPTAETYLVVTDQLFLAANFREQKRGESGWLAGRFPKDFTGPGLQGDKCSVGAAGIDDEFALGEKRRAGHAPLHFLGRAKFLADLLLPENFAGFQLDAVELTECAVEERQVPRDERSGPRGVAVVEVPFGEIADYPRYVARVGFEAAENVGRVKQIPVADDDQAFCRRNAP